MNTCDGSDPKVASKERAVDRARGPYREGVDSGKLVDAPDTEG